MWVLTKQVKNEHWHYILKMSGLFCIFFFSFGCILNLILLPEQSFFLTKYVCWIVTVLCKLKTFFKERQRPTSLWIPSNNVSRATLFFLGRNPEVHFRHLLCSILISSCWMLCLWQMFPFILTEKKVFSRQEKFMSIIK